MQFETPLPRLTPAVFTPILKDLTPPCLDLFDLDEHFSTEKARLAQLSNKCKDEDLEFYIRECGAILGVAGQIGDSQPDAKHILHQMLTSIVNWKKLNPV